MSETTLLLFTANSLLLIHVLFVAFVVLGLVAIYAGGFLRWSWVRRPGFRLLHLAAIAVVVVQSWLGVICPLTVWEMALRNRAGVETYTGSFIQHWLQSLLYYSAPEWVFVLVYTVFGALVVLGWFVVSPRWTQRHGEK